MAEIFAPGKKRASEKRPRVTTIRGIDGGKLAVQITVAGGNFVGLGVAVARRTALDDVRDEHLFAVQPDRGEHLLQQFAGGTDKRPPLLVLVEPRPLANEHDAALDARPRPAPPWCVSHAKTARRAPPHLRANCFKYLLRGFCRHW